MLKIGTILDWYTPSAIRNSRKIMSIIFRFLFKDKADIILDFKENAMQMTEEEFVDVYNQVESVLFRGLLSSETDLSDECLIEILKNAVGPNILEVGCGSGFLAKKLAVKHHVTASDIIIDDGLCDAKSRVKFIEANIENLPFSSQEFDTVICAHTLEHIRNLTKAISELRRVTKSRLIIVVPRQRPFKYTFDLHLHFFPYPESLLSTMGNDRKNMCKKVGYELFYIEYM
jgi:ubiquinone/menaquinone biosynthesis C-methylase UbiE